MKKIKIKLNCDLKNHKKGHIITINLYDIYWRNRLRDAKIDNCIEIVKEKSHEQKVVRISKKPKKIKSKDDEIVKLDRDFNKNY